MGNSVCCALGMGKFYFEVEARLTLCSDCKFSLPLAQAEGPTFTLCTTFILSFSLLSKTTFRALTGCIFA